MKGLEGKTALVTGAGHGIGQAIAARLAEEGAHVMIGDVNDAAGTASADRINAAGGSASATRVDVMQRDSVSAFVEAAVSHYGRVDVLVCNAGIMDRAPFLEMTDALWQQVLGINLYGAFVCGQLAARQMIAQGDGGRIVHVASNSGMFGGRGRAAYGVSKAGLINLTQTMAIELAAHDIRVNAVAPGPTKTRDDQPDELSDSVAGRMPLARYGRPAEIAAVAAFLASDESSFVTGHTYPADGGFTISGIMEG